MAALRELVRIVRTDPVVAANVKTFRSWEGRPTDDDAPAVGNCPWVRLTPGPIRAQREAAIGSTGTFYGRESWTVWIDTVVEGFDPAASFNLWAVLKDALFSQVVATRATRDAALAAVGIADLQLEQPATPAGPEAWSDGLIEARGSVSVWFESNQ